MAYPDDNDLTTLTEVKKWLDIPTSDTVNDPALEALINRASDFFHRLTSRIRIKTGSVTETRDGQGGVRLPTREYPVTAVSSVSIDGIAIPVSSGPLVAGYTFDSDSIILRGGYRFSRGEQNVQIAYTAGYSSSSYELLSIEQAVIELVAQKWLRRQHADLTSKTAVGVQTITYSQKDVPAEVQTVIDRFKFVGIAA